MPPAVLTPPSGPVERTVASTVRRGPPILEPEPQTLGGRILSGERGTSHRTRWLLGAWLAFAVIAVVLACWGWYLQAGVFKATGLRRFENAVYMTLKIFNL